MILFTKSDCPKCDHLKENHDLKGVEVHELTTENHEALGLLAFHEGVAQAEISLPILVLDDHTRLIDMVAIEEQLGGEYDPYGGECDDGECKRD